MVAYTPLRKVISAYASGAVAAAYKPLALLCALPVMLLGKLSLYSGFLVRALLFRGFSSATFHPGMWTMIPVGSCIMRTADSVLIDMLSAGSRGTIRIYTQIRRIDFHIHFFSFRHNGDRRGRRMYPAAGFRFLVCAAPCARLTQNLSREYTPLARNEQCSFLAAAYISL